MKAKTLITLLAMVSVMWLSPGWTRQLTFSSGSASDVENEFEYKGVKYKQVISKEILFSDSGTFNPNTKPSLDIGPVIANALAILKKIDTQRNWVLDDILLDNSGGYWFFTVGFKEESRESRGDDFNLAFSLKGQVGEIEKYEKSKFIVGDEKQND